jgi:hypothetical protein
MTIAMKEELLAMNILNPLSIQKHLFIYLLKQLIFQLPWDIEKL